MLESEVIDELMRQYPVEINAGEVSVLQEYTGTFVHNDLSQALEMVFVAMGIEYKQQPDGSYLLEE